MAAQYGAQMLGFADFAGPIGIAIGFIGTIIGLLMRTTPTIPYFWIGIALDKNTVPTVGSCMLAATQFKVLTAQDHAIPTGGAIVLALDVGDFPTSLEKMKSSESQIAAYQQQMLTPFFMTMVNLTPERREAMVNTLMVPPLWDQADEIFRKMGVALDYNIWNLGDGSLDYGIQDGVKTSYTYFCTVLNDAFLRRIYRSVLDSPAMTPEQYGQAVGNVPVTNETGGDITQAPVPTALPAPLPQTNFLPVLAIGALAFLSMRK